MSFHYYTYPSAQAAGEACAHQVIRLLQQTLAGQERATFAISGGSTPVFLFRELAASSLPWERIHLFWVDERAVPPTDPESNYRSAEQHLIVPARIPIWNVHRIPAELKPHSAARRYADDIREFFELQKDELPHFDVVHQGVGADAHTASLFPGEPLIDDRTSLAAAVHVEKLGQWRITLLPGVLLAARQTVFLTAGADKAEAVRCVFQCPYEPKRYPAQVVSHHGRSVTWYLDEPAAARLQDESDTNQ